MSKTGKQLTEGKVCKGGQNPTDEIGERPPAPSGSGGDDMIRHYSDTIAYLRMRNAELREALFEARLVLLPLIRTDELLKKIKTVLSAKRELDFDNPEES